MTEALSQSSQGFARIPFARRIIQSEAAALLLAANRLGDSFDRAVGLIAGGRGRVAIVGVGKSADVGQKIAGTFNSTGTRAYLLDATRAVHGDLGMVAPEDLALLLSHSGESEELLRLLPYLEAMCSALIAVTGNGSSTLARTVDCAIVYGPVVEACPLSLAPSASTTIMLALGDALAFCLSEERRFGPEDFARYHPAGSLGRKLATVESAMRRGADLRLASADATVREVFAAARHQGRRTGAVMLVEADGSLAGLFTDSDLARLFEARSDHAFDQPMRAVMIRSPITVTPAARLIEAVELMRSKKISELPVVDAAGRPIGLLDITDVIGLLPATADSSARPPLKLFHSSGA